MFIQNQFFIRILLLALFPVLTVSAQNPQAAPPFPSMKVGSWSLRVRSEDGSYVCSIPQGTGVQPMGRDKSGTRIQVQINAKGCPSTGWVDHRYLRPQQSASEFEEAETDIAGLSLRKEPKMGDSSYLCGLEEGTSLEVLPQTEKGSVTTWLKVKVTSPNSKCQGEGWVAAAYLRPRLNFKDLPEGKNLQKESASETNNSCDTKNQANKFGQQKNLDPIATSARDIPSGQSPFLSALLELDRTRRCPAGSAYNCSRGLIQMPIMGRNAGFCGTHHYRADTPIGIDSYAAPMTACAFTALAQEWRKTECPDQGGCRIAWGDISHKTRPRFNGHTTHTDGKCFDVRPLARGEFVDAGLSYRETSRYDREKTKKLIEMARLMGASTVLFNDPQVDASPVTGHDDHVHICFSDDQKAKQTCQNLRVDPSLCPELQ